MEAKMVSARIALLFPMAVAISLLHAQAPVVPPVASGFLNESRPDPSPSVESTSKKLTPEMRGDIYMARKMYREAADMYATGDLKSPLLLNKLGIAYHQMVEVDLAQRYYERAIKLDKNYPEAINNLGAVLYAKKNYRRAVTMYNRALKLSPNSASMHSNLGTAQFARKKYKEALECYDRALALDPNVFEHRSSNGVLLQERSVSERARFHYFLAKTYAKAGSIDRALLYMRKSLEEGFKERSRYKEDPEFAQLQDNPEFQQLLTLEPRVL